MHKFYIAQFDVPRLQKTYAFTGIFLIFQIYLSVRYISFDSLYNIKPYSPYLKKYQRRCYWYLRERMSPLVGDRTFFADSNLKQKHDIYAQWHRDRTKNVQSNPCFELIIKHRKHCLTVRLIEAVTRIFFGI